MIKKILVPIAFSRFTEGMLRFAAEIAGACGAELQLINVINERDLEAVQKITAFGYKVDTEHYLQTLIQERREEMTRLLAKVGLNGDEVPFHFEVGNPAFDKGLTFFGRIVVGIFRQIAVRTGFRNGTDDCLTFFGFKALQLFFQQLCTVLCKWNTHNSRPS